jgi:hypothetical protein
MQTDFSLNSYRRLTVNHDTKSESNKAASNSQPKVSPEQESMKPAKTPNNGGTRSQTTVTPDERYHMIAVAAYCGAESRAFIGGDEVEDWLAAESEIEKLLANRLPGL